MSLITGSENLFAAGEQGAVCRQAHAGAARRLSKFAEEATSRLAPCRIAYSAQGWTDDARCPNAVSIMDRGSCRSSCTSSTAWGVRQVMEAVVSDKGPSRCVNSAWSGRQLLEIWRWNRGRDPNGTFSVRIRWEPKRMYSRVYSGEMSAMARE